MHEPIDPPEGPNIFGLPEAPADASIVLIPAPFDATSSFRRGSRYGPAAIHRTSEQLDLHDARFGPVWRHGLHMEPIPRALLERSEAVSPDADRVYEIGEFEDRSGVADSIHRIGEACETVRRYVLERCARALEAGKIPGVVGGEHSVSLGALEAAGGAGSFGVLQIDAHLDLRPAYLGVSGSHASIMRNAHDRIDAISTIVSVGARDASAMEWAFAHASDRVRVFADHTLHDERFRGRSWSDQVEEIIQALPASVYVSVDIDGLDPSLCPSTGTPVPGGLSYEALSFLLERLARSGRRIVGFDLVEVSPGETLGPGDGIDAIVGARVLYRLCGAAGMAHAVQK
ncbi:MAG: arginase family protein [Planctomycetota bacterium]